MAGFIETPWAKTIVDALRPGSITYDLVYIGLIIFFAYFYTAIQFNTADVAENMKKFGGYIPGIRPGQRTAEYIDRVLSRITLGGALYVAAVCILPTMLVSYHVPFYWRHRSADRVGVALDTVAQMGGLSPATSGVCVAGGCLAQRSDAWRASYD
jgi:preprotein translocase subunit SecY